MSKMQLAHKLFTSIHVSQCRLRSGHSNAIRLEKNNLHFVRRTKSETCLFGIPISPWVSFLNCHNMHSPFNHNIHQVGPRLNKSSRISVRRCLLFIYYKNERDRKWKHAPEIQSQSTSLRTWETHIAHTLAVRRRIVPAIRLYEFQISIVHKVLPNGSRTKYAKSMQRAALVCYVLHVRSTRLCRHDPERERKNMKWIIYY